MTSCYLSWPFCIGVDRGGPGGPGGGGGGGGGGPPKLFERGGQHTLWPPQ